MLGQLSPDDLALYGTARSVLDWHARHRFCARCGQPTALAKGGWQRNCPGCGTSISRASTRSRSCWSNATAACCSADRRGSRRARNRRSRASSSPARSIEDAVRREVFEEAGVTVGEVRYIASQPWPFPSQLMVGCLGFADSLELSVNTSEIEDARWFSREEVAEAMAKGRDSASFVPPPAQAIAHHLLQWWLENEP
jgi:NAD+ diphosphatase